MKTKTYNSALNFLPEAKPVKTGRPEGLVATLRKFFAAIDAGLEAQQAYKKHTAHGMPSAAAAAAAFREHLK